MRGLAKGIEDKRLVDAFKLEAFLCDCGAAGEPCEEHAKDCPWVSAQKLLTKGPKVTERRYRSLLNRAHSVIDGFMGDSDMPNDGSEEMRLMKAISKVLA